MASIILLDTKQRWSKSALRPTTQFPQNQIPQIFKGRPDEADPQRLYRPNWKWSAAGILVPDTPASGSNGIHVSKGQGCASSKRGGPAQLLGRWSWRYSPLVYTVIQSWISHISQNLHQPQSHLKDKGTGNNSQSANANISIVPVTLFQCPSCVLKAKD